MRNRDNEDELSDILIDDDDQEIEKKKSGSKKIFLVVAMAFILLLVVVFAIYALTRGEESEQPSSAQPPSVTPSPIVPPQTQTNTQGFSDVGINNVGSNVASNDTTPSRDKFEDIIAKIKSEQNKNNPNIPLKPQPQPQSIQPAQQETKSPPPVVNIAPPTSATSNEDIKGLFKPQAPEPPKETIITQSQPPPKEAPKPKPAASSDSQVPPKIVSVASNPNGKFYIQAASVSKFSEESDFAKKIKNHKLPYIVQEENINNRTVYRILIGPYGSRADALNVLKTVRYYLEKEAFVKQIND